MKIKLVVNEERGEIYCTHKDFLMKVLQEMGQIRIERASDVEFDNERGVWVANFRGLPGWPQCQVSAHQRDEVLQRESNFIDTTLLTNEMWRHNIFETTPQQPSAETTR